MTSLELQNRYNDGDWDYPEALVFDAIDALKKCEAERDQFRGALESYAKPSNWKMVNEFAVWVGAGIGGELARYRLKEEDGDV